MASQSFYVHLDLNKNEIHNFAVQNLASAPSGPVSGQMYFSSTDTVIYYYNGTSWVTVSPGISSVTSSDSAQIDFSGLGTSGSPLTATIIDDSITFSKVQDIATARILGRTSSGTGDVEQLSLGTGLQFSGSTIRIATFSGGDISYTAGTHTATINNGSVTLAKMANLAASSIIGNNTGSAAAPIALSAAQVKSMLLITSSDISDFTAAARSSISVTDTATLDLTYSGGAISGVVLNSPQLNGQNAAYYLNRGNHTGSQTASTISDFDTQVRTNRLDQMAAPTSNVSLNNQRLVSLADPVNAQDAATKSYVDAAQMGLDVKESVRAGTTGNITLSGIQTIDGVALVAGNRVLVKNQSTGAQNGIYIVASGAWTRSPDADGGNELSPGTFTFIEEGTTQADSGWVLATDGNIIIGTTAQTWVQFSGAGQIEAGNGLSKSGNTISAVGTANRITVSASAIDIATNYVGQTSITTLGTITTGTWQGSTITANNGGTGRASHTAYMPIVGGTTTTGAQQSVSTGSATGQALTYQGTSALPAFAAINLAGGTNIVTGTLPATNGGTGNASYAVGDILFASTTSALSRLAGVATGNALISGGTNTAPSWGKIGLTTHVTGTLGVANGGTGLATVTSGSFLVGNGTGALTQRTAAQVLTDIGAAPASHNHDADYARVVSQTIGNGSASAFPVTHNFNTRAVGVQVFRTGSPYDTIGVEVVRNTVNQITINTNNIPTAGEYTVVIWGIDG